MIGISVGGSVCSLDVGVSEGHVLWMCETPFRYRSGIRVRIKQSACVSMDGTPAIILLIICNEGAPGCRKRNIASAQMNEEKCCGKTQI